MPPLNERFLELGGVDMGGIVTEYPHVHEIL